jgi:hypothetical protein
LTPQIVREYLAVATRPVDANGFGLATHDAIANVHEFLDDMDLLAEDAAATNLLMRLVSDHQVAGKQVHDANVVAVALAHGALAIVTDNIRHFSRFSGLIGVESVADVAF